MSIVQELQRLEKENAELVVLFATLLAMSKQRAEGVLDITNKKSHYMFLMLTEGLGRFDQSHKAAAYQEEE